MTDPEAIAYWKKNVVPGLHPALVELARVRPADPVSWLGQRLLSKSTKIIFVLGGPGSGKGTQCAKLVQKYGFMHVSAGDLLRAEVKSGSSVGTMVAEMMKEGKIVPMEITLDLLKKAMAECSGEYLLIDGFPRKLDQGMAFEKDVAQCTTVLFFDCPEDVMQERLLERGKTSGRADDNIETIKKRFDTFTEQSMPVIEHYAKQGKVCTISAVPHPDEVHGTVLKELAAHGVKVRAAAMSKKVVILCTSAEDFQGHKSGAWSEEVSGPFYTFTGKGCEVTIASINGGKVPIDAFSLSEGFKTQNDTKFETTGDVKKLESTVAVSTLAPEAFDCIFLAGGHGTVVDFPDGAADIVSKAAAAGKVVGAVCHGPHGLLKATVDGKPLVAGKKVCGFSNEEEAAVIGMRKFEEKITSLEDELKAKGGEYVTGAMFAPNAVRDGSLITGQNPGSSVKAAELCCEALGL